MKKKIIKVLVIVLVIIMLIVIGDYIYLEIQISKEEARIENEKNNKFLIEDNNRIRVICEIPMNDAWETITYCIDLENETVETRSSSGNYRPLKGNRLLIWNEKRLELEDLKMTQYNKITNTKLLSNKEKQQVESLINRICNEEKNISEEDNNELDEDTFGSLIYAIKLSGNYKITTKDKFNITMDNKNDIKLFLKLVE